MDTLKPVVIDFPRRDEFVPELNEIAAAEGIKAACSVPLVNRGRVLGILEVQLQKGPALDERTR
jgi:GAF domain-containing protein